VQRSKKEGFRSRSAYKLLEIDERDKLLRAGQVIVDLGSAPGDGRRSREEGGRPAEAWSRSTCAGWRRSRASPSSGGLHVAGRARGGRKALAGRKADVVLSDMAPEPERHPDERPGPRMALAEIALEFARLHLKPEGALLVKVFQGAGIDEYLGTCAQPSLRCLVRKPESSRGESAEQYLLARGLKAGEAP
jgi:23S rRNA (uridine2552-2'-O)-methyltransferase